MQAVHAIAIARLPLAICKRTRLFLQGSDVVPVKAEAAALRVRLEAFADMLTNSACLHRIFFQRLVWCARAACSPQPPADFGPEEPGIEGDQGHALKVFMDQHFLEDPLTRELQVCLFGQCGSAVTHKVGSTSGWATYVA